MHPTSLPPLSVGHQKAICTFLPLHNCCLPGCHHAIQLGQEGKVPLKSARLFFDISEKVRQVLESYFRLDSALYFSYSHLVCRSAIDGKPGSYGGSKGS